VLGEFRNFILRGNVVDLAVGIVIGAAFTAIVNSLVADLLTPHGVIQPLTLDQLVVTSRFDDPPLLQHEDPVGMQHGRQPVGDDQGDDVAVGADGADRGGDAFLGQRVER